MTKTTYHFFLKHINMVLLFLFLILLLDRKYASCISNINSAGKSNSINHFNNHVDNEQSRGNNIQMHSFKERKTLYFSLVHETKHLNIDPNDMHYHIASAIRDIEKVNYRYASKRKPNTVPVYESVPEIKTLIQAISKSASTNKTSNKLPASLFNLGGMVLGSGKYYANISLGSANQMFSVIVDTGSDLLWVPCECTQCATSSNFMPLNPEYNSDLSSTSQNLFCTDDECLAAMNSTKAGKVSCSNPPFNLCAYEFSYISDSSSTGTLVRDTFNLNVFGLDGSVKSKVTFGCGRYQTNTLLNLGVDGVMGMGSTPLSIASQLHANGIIENEFSVCLEGSKGGGHLVMGASNLPRNMTYANLLPDNLLAHYYLELDSLSVGEYPVSLSSVSTQIIIDTASTFTLLPEYLFEGFLQNLLVIGKVLKFSDASLTAYRCFSKAPETDKDLLARFQPILLNFKNSTWKIPATNYFFKPIKNRPDVVCFTAFLSSVDVSIIGESWIRDFLLHFDSQNQRLGWTQYNCSSTIDVLPASASKPLPSNVYFPNSPPPASSSPSSSPSPTPSSSDGYFLHSTNIIYLLTLLLSVIFHFV